ncbi:hypothetical protein SUGI_0067910 [Cryptomeria japonica]|nr:hypothetical protein SUGI_0067910 [Cryptomeria japonica]
MDKPGHLVLHQEEISKEDDLADHEKACDEQETRISLDKKSYSFDFTGHMQDSDYMKKRLMEWVRAVAAYVRFLHYTHIT